MATGTERGGSMLADLPLQPGGAVFDTAKKVLSQKAQALLVQFRGAEENR